MTNEVAPRNVHEMSADVESSTAVAGRFVHARSESPWAFKQFPGGNYLAKCQAVSFFILGNCPDIPPDRTRVSQEEIL